MLNELNSGGQLCDLMIGDSQWIGRAAENGWYLKLNDFFAAEGISMDVFVPATVTAYSEWPKNTPNYWSLPAFGDVVGWTYRKDWFERPEIQAAFKEKTGLEMGRGSPGRALHDHHAPALGLDHLDQLQDRARQHLLPAQGLL